MSDNDLIVISSEGSTRKWNLFREVENERDFRDLARSLYPIPPSERDPHWLQCAQSVARALFTALYRRGEEEGKAANNGVLLRFVQRHNLEEIYEFINGYEDLRGSAMHVDPNQPRHAYSVWSTVQAIFDRVFYGDFAKAGDFSIREYVQNPNKKTVILDMRSESEAPVFRLLVDWGIKHSLVDDDRRKYFLLDEFQQIPHLQNLGALLNTGRFYRCQSLLGLQSIAQLQSKYGRTSAEGILAGFPQVVAHRSGDRATVNFVRSKMGKIQLKREFSTWESVSGYANVYGKASECYPYSEQQHNTLETGEAIAITPTSRSSPFHVWPLPRSRMYLEPIYDGIIIPENYVLPVSDRGVSIVVREGSESGRKKGVDDIRFRRDLSLLVVGETGSGKTTTLQLFAAQQAANLNEPKIVFDYKSDWKEFFEDEDNFVIPEYGL